MTNIPADHISLPEAFTRFREVFEREQADQKEAPLADRLRVGFNGGESAVQERITVASIKEFRDALADSHVVAYDADSKVITALVWRGFEMEQLSQVFYTPVLFVHEPTFNKWMIVRSLDQGDMGQYAKSIIGSRINLDLAISALSGRVPDETLMQDARFFACWPIIPNEAAAKRLSVNAISVDHGKPVTIPAGEWGHLKINPTTGSAELKGVPVYTDLLFHIQQVIVLRPHFESTFAQYCLRDKKWRGLSEGTTKWLAEKVKSHLPTPSVIPIDDELPAEAMSNNTPIAPAPVSAGIADEEEQLTAISDESSGAFARACTALANSKDNQRTKSVRALRKLVEIYQDGEPEDRYAKRITKRVNDSGVVIAHSTLKKLLVQIYKDMVHIGPH